MRRKRLVGDQPWLFDSVVPGVQVERYVCTFCGPRDGVRPPGRRFFTLRGLRIHRAKMHRDRLPVQNPLPLA